MHNNCNTKHNHLTMDLRKLIEKWKKEGKSNREITRLLGKNYQTINNEIKRESVIQRTDKQRIFLNKKKCFKLCKKRKNGRKRERIFEKSIEEIPKEINNREEVGHYEIDTVILRKEKGQCLLTLTDRKSRYEIIRLIEDETVKSVNKALKEVLKEYEIKSITADNGLEFARVYEVFDYENIYYAHPYSSYERGSNENHN